MLVLAVAVEEVDAGKRLKRRQEVQKLLESETVADVEK